MKEVYHLGDDLFIALGFVSFVLGGFFRLMGLDNVFFGFSPRTFIDLAIICLLFSIALSLYDVAHGKK